MTELEDQLRRLAAHRAEQVPDYVPPTSIASPRRRRRPIVITAIAAAVVVALVATGIALWPGDSRPARVIAPATSDTTTSTPTTTIPITPSCQAPAALPATTGPSSYGNPDWDDQLYDVREWSARCFDVVRIDLQRAHEPTEGASPPWTAAYRDAPFPDPVAYLADVGRAHLVVRLPRVADGQLVGNVNPILSTNSAGVLGVSTFADPEGGVTVVIALDEVLPFHVGRGVDGLIVSFTSPAPRSPSCRSNEGYSVDAPGAQHYGQSWVVEMSVSCRLFAPQPVQLYPDGNWQVVNVGFLPYDPIDNPSTRVVAEHTETIDGRPARAVEVEWTNDQGLGVGVGTRDYYWIIDVDGRNFVVSALRGPGAQYDVLKAGADAIARSARFD